MSRKVECHTEKGWGADAGLVAGSYSPCLVVADFWRWRSDVCMLSAECDWMGVGKGGECSSKYRQAKQSNAKQNEAEQAKQSRQIGL